MTKDSILHLQKQLQATDLCGDKVMIDFDSGKYYLLKGVGSDIWEMLTDNISVNDIIQHLLSEYDVTPEECESSVLTFLTDLEKNGIISI